MHKQYYKELGELKPMADGEARLSHYGKHYFITTEIKLVGRGIELISANRYKVTINAFDKLCEKYDFSQQLYLD